MSKETKIQWCDSSCNPTMGCDGCELWSETNKSCYAGVLHRIRSKQKGFADNFEKVELFPGRMAKATAWPDLAGVKREEKPWLDGFPRLIFVSDMSDALSAAVPFDYLKSEVIDPVTSQNGQRHCWLWLTKRPDRMAKFSRWLAERQITWPINLWAGTSITSQSRTTRIKGLLKVGNEHTTRFLSVEPQHEQIDITQWLPKLDWLIQGGESGPSAQPFDIGWAETMANSCKLHGVAYFLKQLGKKPFNGGEAMKLKDGHGGDWSEWPAHLRIRQMPKRKNGLSSNALGQVPKKPIPPEVSERQRLAVKKAWETIRARASKQA